MVKALEVEKGRRGKGEKGVWQIYKNPVSGC